MSPNYQKKSWSAPDSPSSIKYSGKTQDDPIKCSEEPNEEMQGDYINIINSGEPIKKPKGTFFNYPTGFFYKLFDVLVIAWFIVFIIAIFVSIIPSAIEAANRPETCICQQGGEQDAASS